jgi:hypothetical protein
VSEKKFIANFSVTGAKESEVALAKLDTTAVKLGNDTVKVSGQVASASKNFATFGSTNKAITAPISQVSTELTKQTQVLPKSVSSTNQLSGSLNQLKTGYANTRGPQDLYSQGQDNIIKKSGGLKTSLQGVGGQLTTQVGSYAAVSGSAWALYNAVDNLEKKELAASKAKLAVEQANLKVSKAQELVNKLASEGKQGTLDYQQAQEALSQSQEKLSLAMERNEIIQGDLQEDYAALVTNILPLVLSLGGSVTTMFGSMSGILPKLRGGLTSVKTAFMGTGVAAREAGISMKGALIGTGIGAVVVLIGTFLEAFANNWWGVRDAINGVGKAIGDALPFLRPFLDFLGWVGGGIQQAFGSDTQKAFADTGDAMKDTGSSAEAYAKQLVIVDNATKGLQQATGLTAADLIDKLGPAFVSMATGADTAGTHMSKLVEFQTKIAAASEALKNAVGTEDIKKASDHLKELIGNYNDWIKTQDDATKALGLNNDTVAKSAVVVSQYNDELEMWSEADNKLLRDTVALIDAQIQNIKYNELAAKAVKRHTDFLNDMFAPLEQQNKELKDLAENYGFGLKAIEKYTNIEGLSSDQVAKKNAEFFKLIQTQGTYNAESVKLGNAISRFTTLSEYDNKLLEDKRTNLLEAAKATGISNAELMKYVDTTGKSSDVIRDENDALAEMILARKTDISAVTDQHEKYLLLVEGMTKGTEAGMDWYKQLVINAQAEKDEEGTIRAIADALGLTFDKQIGMSIEKVKEWVQNLVDGGVSLDKLKESIKAFKGFEFDLINEEKWKDAKKKIREFFKDIKMPGKQEAKIEAELHLKFKAKDQIDEAQKLLQGTFLAIDLKVASPKQVIQDIDAVLGKLKGALAKGADVQPFIDLLEKIKTSKDPAGEFVKALSQLTGLSAEQIMTDTGAMVDNLNLEGPDAAAKIKLISDAIEGTGPAAETTKEPLNAFQQQIKDIQDLNKVMNTHYIEGLNAMGNKTEEFRNFAGVRFKAIRDQVVHNLEDINKTMNTHFIAGLNAGGNKSNEFRTTVDKNMDTMRSIAVGDLQNVNKIMNSHFIAGLNAGGNKTNEFKNTATKNFDAVGTSARNLTSDIDELANELADLDGTKSTVTIETVHLTKNNSCTNCAKGGSFFTGGGFQQGGAFIETHQRNIDGHNIAEFDKPELHIIQPLTDPDNPADRNMSVSLPTVSVGTKGGDGNMLGRFMNRFISAMREQSFFVHQTTQVNVDGQQVYNAMRPHQLRRLSNLL